MILPPPPPQEKPGRQEARHWCGGTLVFSRASTDPSHSRERCTGCDWQYGFTTGR